MKWFETFRIFISLINDNVMTVEVRGNYIDAILHEVIRSYSFISLTEAPIQRLSHTVVKKSDVGICVVEKPTPSFLVSG